MRFLVTGFAPFGNSPVNSAGRAVASLPKKLGKHTVYKAELPVEYEAAPQSLLDLIKAVKPHCVLAVGQAAGREGISIENTAVNVKASNAPDNAGVTFSGEKIEEEGADPWPPISP